MTPPRDEHRGRGAREQQPRPAPEPAAEAERPGEGLRDLDGTPPAGDGGGQAAEPADEAAPGAGAAPSEGAAPPEEPDQAEQVPEDPLMRAETARDEYLALAQRTQADFDNYRKRAARETAAAGARAKAELVRAMLPVVDNLERALESAGEDEATLAEGVRLVHAELVGALERSGVSSIEAAGERFDPNVHEALSTRPDDGAEAGTVLDVVQKGYRLDGTVLRPARVVVAA